MACATDPTAEADVVCRGRQPVRRSVPLRDDRRRRRARTWRRRARDARYAVLPSDVMTGHTADDQAETMLINLMRGASTTGLAAMRPGARRPILALRRPSTAMFCLAQESRWSTTPANRDPAFLRNRVRHELLPLMGELAVRDLVPVLTRQADLFRDDERSARRIGRRRSTRPTRDCSLRRRCPWPDARCGAG